MTAKPINSRLPSIRSHGASDQSLEGDGSPAEANFAGDHDLSAGQRTVASEGGPATGAEGPDPARINDANFNRKAFFEEVRQRADEQISRQASGRGALRRKLASIRPGGPTAATKGLRSAAVSLERVDKSDGNGLLGRTSDHRLAASLPTDWDSASAAGQVTP